MPNTRLLPLVALVAACASPQADAPTATAPQVVHVIATDYAFSAPDTLQAGLVTWQLENRGEDGHHLIVYRIDGGHTLDEALAEVAIDRTWPDWLPSLGGPEGTETPDLGGSFTMNLAPGNYLLICAITHPEGNTHAAHGMVHPLVVVGESVAAEPVATDTIRMIDFAYDLPDTITAGEVRFRLVNAGGQRHHAIMEQVPDTADIMQVFADFEQPEPPPGYRPVGGFTSMAPGELGWYNVTLVPGRYLIACLIGDPGSGQPHVELGMVKLVEVVERET